MFSINDKDKVREFIQSKRFAEEQKEQERQEKIIEETENLKINILKELGIRQLTDDEVFNRIKDVVNREGNKEVTLNYIERLLMLRRNTEGKA